MGLYLGELGGGEDSVGEVGKIANEMLMMSLKKEILVGEVPGYRY